MTEAMYKLSVRYKLGTRLAKTPDMRMDRGVSNRAASHDLFRSIPSGIVTLYPFELKSIHIAENCARVRSRRKHASKMIVLLATAGGSVESTGVHCGRLRWWLSFSLGGCDMEILWGCKTEKER